MINFRFILKLYGKLLYIECAFIALCALVALLYRESDLYSFLWTGGIILVFALLLSRILPAKDNTLTRKDGYFIVSTIWVLFSLFGCLPYIFSGSIPSFTDAFFETISGFTTTGASTLTDIEVLPHATLFWRSLTQWLGGMGIITLFIALLPSLGIEGRDLFIAEDTSPVHSKTGATFAFTTRSLWGIYAGLTVICTLMMWLGGMGWFDAVNHALTTISSGGFSTKNASLAYWNTPYIQYVTIFFMFIAGVNFTLLFSLFTRHRKRFFKDAELAFYFWLSVACSLIIAAVLYFNTGASWEKALRDAMFQVVAIFSSTGFVSADYTVWPGAVIPILALLMFLGACSGSTTGGLKCIRGLLVVKNIIAEMKRIIHPNAIILVKYNKKGVQPYVTNAVMNFFVLYVLLIATSIAILYPMLEGYDWATTASAALTSLSNVGPGLGETGTTSNFSWMPSYAKMFCAALMLIGRLEFFTVLVLFTREFWRK